MGGPEGLAAARCVELSCERVGKFAVFGGRRICPPGHAGPAVDVDAEHLAALADLADLRPPAGGVAAEDRWFRRSLLALMLSITFGGGALFGLLAGSLGLPGVWWAPVLLVLSGGFWLFVRRG